MRTMSARARAGLAMMLLAAAVVLGFVIYSGVRSRVRAASALRRATLEMATLTVSVVHPKSKAPAEEVVLPGNMQGYVASPVYARVNGYLKKWYFDIGAHVKNGDLLAEIDTPELDRQLDQARADLAAAEANYQLAQTTADRYRLLFKTDSVSKQDVEDKVGDLEAKKAIVDSATYNMRRLAETQAFQKVYAPFDGVVTARNIDIGALIDAGANAPGKELFDMSSTDRLRVYVNVPQIYSRAATPGSTADLTLEEFPGRHFPAQIVRTADAIDPASRTLLTEVDVDNPTGELLPGAFVQVHLRLAPKNVRVMIPVNTLIFRSEGLQVAVVRNGKAVLLPITNGRDYGNEVEVVSGLAPEDEVIENPTDSLTSGTAVRLAPQPVRRNTE